MAPMMAAQRNQPSTTKTRPKHTTRIPIIVRYRRIRWLWSSAGEVCAEVIAGKAAAKDWVTIPGIIFTDPEIATVGITEAQAKQKGLTVKVGRFPFSVLGRAMSIGETDGFVKVVTEQKTGRVLGIHIVGPNASDLISEAALALEVAATAEDVALTVHPHPTLGEALMEAAAHSIGHAIHIANR